MDTRTDNRAGISIVTRVASVGTVAERKRQRFIQEMAIDAAFRAYEAEKKRLAAGFVLCSKCENSEAMAGPTKPGPLCYPCFKAIDICMMTGCTAKRWVHEYPYCEAHTCKKCHLGAKTGLCSLCEKDEAKPCSSVCKQHFGGSRKE
jgi:hypothetical protein